MSTLLSNIHECTSAPGFFSVSVKNICPGTGRLNWTRVYLVNPLADDIFDMETGEQLNDKSMRNRILEALKK